MLWGVIQKRQSNEGWNSSLKNKRSFGFQIWVYFSIYNVNIFPQSNMLVLHWLISVRLWSQSKVLNAKFHLSIVGGSMESLFSSAAVHNELHPTLNPVQHLLSQNGTLIAASAHFCDSYKEVHLMLKVRQIPNTHIHIVYTLFPCCKF